MAQGRRRAMLVAVAALAGAAIAFPVGLYFGRPIAPVEQVRPRAMGSASLRNRYSPDMLADPHFIDQQRRVVESLGSACRRSGAHCAEARAARARLTELGG